MREKTVNQRDIFLADNCIQGQILHPQLYPVCLPRTHSNFKLIICKILPYTQNLDNIFPVLLADTGNTFMVHE